MRMDLRSEGRTRVAWLEIDPTQPPPVVRVPKPTGGEEEHYLEWDRAFDDEGNLRRCPACGCETLYRRSTTPPLTGFLVTLVVGLIGLLLWGVSDAPLALVVGALVVVAVMNLLIILFARRYLVCYRCDSRFHRVGISRGIGEWDAAEAEAYRPDRPVKPTAEEEKISAGPKATEKESGDPA